MPPPNTPELATATEYPANDCALPSTTTCQCAWRQPRSARSVA